MQPGADHISKKKIPFSVTKPFARYLKRYGRAMPLPVSYQTLRHFENSIPVKDINGQDTFWETVFYQPTMADEIHAALKRVYSLLKSSGHFQAEEHLHIERIDFCLFGNSKPFRIKIVNNYNEVYDYFYIKTADASRIFGMELEHLLSPYWINFLVDGDTLAEEHIAGIPGDIFVKDHLNRPVYNRKKIAKEFVKFNERCFVRLLGDMRSYNFVFDIVQDFDDIQFRIRAIDFDQQCYEGNKNIYLPQFFKENLVFVHLVQELLHPDVIRQYQLEETSQIIRRIKAQRHRLRSLKNAAADELLSTPEKIIQLATELGEFHQKSAAFLACKTMPEIMYQHLKELLLREQQMK
jgi:hypothetical protein